MKKITMMILSAAALLTTACSSDEMQQQTAQTGNGWSEYITVEAGTPGGADASAQGSRRVAVNPTETKKSQWEDGDQLTIWTGDIRSENLSEHGFKLISGAGTGTGKFSGRLNSQSEPTSSTPLYAVIDNENDAIEVDGNNVTANLATQVGATAASAFDYELFYATSTYATRNFNFTHKMSLIKWTIQVNGASNGDQCDIVLRGTGLKNSATLDPATGNLTVGSEDGIITLKDVILTDAASTVLYVVLPPCTVSSGIKAKLTMTSGDKQGQIAIGNLGDGDAITLAENKYYTAGPNEFTLRDDVVDLGLPSGTLWAKMNVGASKPDEYGDYFAWGETTGYGSDTSDGRSFDWAGYTTAYGTYDSSASPNYGFTKYNNSGDSGTYTVLQPEDDAATANWGSAWKMPTHAQWQELVSQYPYSSSSRTKRCCWTSNYNSTGVAGLAFYDASDNILLFLPAAGYRYDTSLSGQGSSGRYWSSELGSDDPVGAWRLRFNDSSVKADNIFNRCGGQSVRPVLVQ